MGWQAMKPLVWFYVGVLAALAMVWSVWAFCRFMVWWTRPRDDLAELRAVTRRAFLPRAFVELYKSTPGGK